MIKVKIAPKKKSTVQKDKRNSDNNIKKSKRGKKKVSQKNKTSTNTNDSKVKLHTLVMCKMCKKDCKISAVKGAELIKCPDFEEKQ